MKNRLIYIALAAITALSAVACGVSIGSNSAADPTPTAIPIELITADPSVDRDAFKASLTQAQAECFEAEIQTTENVFMSAGPAGALPDLGSFAAFQGLKCMDDATAQRLYIGQVDRLAGGLSNTSLNCMVERTNSTSFTGLFSEDEAVMRDALQADNIMSLLQSIFCLNDEERLTFETSLAGEQEGFRPGMIDGLECTVDYRDASGRLVVQDAIALFSFLSESEGAFDGEGIPPAAREMIAALFDFIPVVVECGLVTDEDLVDTGLTADQLVCASRSLKNPFLSLMETASSGAADQMDFGLLADLFAALDECGIDLEDIDGMDSLFGDGSGGMFDFGDIAPELETMPSTGQELSLEDLGEFLTEAQLVCLMENLTQDDIELMMETGQPPANMFALMATCNITIDQFIAGF